ncbi:MAG: aspartate--tRNA ligase [bacterium]|nr:aspartate--tRNA ligase [bacterium]
MTAQDLGKSVVIAGWVNKLRNLGGMTFIDLRDRYGITQVTYDPSVATFELPEIKSEYVLQIHGEVIARPENMLNPDMPTGAIELKPTAITILAACKELPFSVDHENPVGEDLRLEYRYLDLRRKTMKENAIMRHKIYLETMNFFDQRDFLHLETPTFVKNTPEGSREYVVPARFEPGRFFVLPQSPQQHKQMLMVSGMDKYFQIARCYRDEDPRGDRQPEFTQVDFELSFVEQKDIMALIEDYFNHMNHKFFPERKVKAEPFPVMTWKTAMDLYGVDKPELRVDNFEFKEVTARANQSEFKLFQESECVKALVLPKELGRSEIEKKYETFIKSFGAGGLPWLCLSETEGVKGSIAKFFSPEQIEELKKLTGATTGTTILFQAGSWLKTCELMGKLRLEAIKQLNLLEGKEDELAFCFVVDMPLFEEGDDGELGATHHPFTKPKDADIPFVKMLGAKLAKGEILTADERKQLLSVKSDAYDIVLNGYELGGGSIRIHDTELQHAIFSLLGLTEEQIQVRFGHLLKCFEYGVPPHGGCAFGLDRIVMLYQKMENIREVILFPKNQKYRDLMLNAPSDIDASLLQDLGLTILPTEKN